MKFAIFISIFTKFSSKLEIFLEDFSHFLIGSARYLVPDFNSLFIAAESILC